MTAPFFDYTCDQCGEAFCERILLMNLALDYTDDAYCVACLAELQELDPESLLPSVKGYIQSRECFKTPWDKFDPTPCPLATACTCREEAP